MISTSLAQELPLLATPAIANSAIAQLPLQIEALALSQGNVVITNFSQSPVALGTSTFTEAFSTLLSPDARVATTVNATAVFLTQPSNPIDIAVNNTQALTQGIGQAYRGVAQSSAAIVGRFLIGQGDLFAFDFTATLGLQTFSSSSRPEVAIASGSIVFNLFDNEVGTVLDEFGLFGESRSDDETVFTIFQTSDDVSGTIARQVLPNGVDTAQLVGSYSRLFDGEADITLVEAKANTAIVQVAPQSADVIQGTDGSDNLNGNSGDNSFDGGAGDDQINGNGGNDTILGGAGSDRINAANGSDFLAGGFGDDQINGNGGNDLMFGGAGNDTLNGGSNNDYVDGGSGDDQINGNGGNDTILGGAGNDIITTGAGDDLIDGGTGNDLIQLNGGQDVVVLDVNEGFDTIRNFQLGSTQFDVGSGPLSFVDAGNGVNIFQLGDQIAFVDNVRASVLSANQASIFI